MMEYVQYNVTATTVSNDLHFRHMDFCENIHEKKHEG